MMKRIALTIFMLIVSCVVMTAQGKHLLKFSETAHDFGTVSQKAAPVVHEYEFINTSTEPVAVLSASAQCGCTRPEYPVKPLAPGERGVIKVTFEPLGQVGNANKDVVVRYRGAKASSSQRITLRLTGVVTP